MNVAQELAVWFLPILFAITFHEVAHGWVALQFGDQTAKRAGRITLNPVHHIDWIGTIILPMVMLFLSGIIFGWAKPVPINARNFKHPKRDMAIVALAGPVSNLIMAILWAGLIKIGMIYSSKHPALMGLVYMGKAGVLINLLLFVFNLFPIPPLDGSKVIMGFMPTKMAWEYAKLETYGFFILLILIVVGIGRFILPPLFLLQDWIFRLFNIQ